jgi:hypothetical protein
MKSARIQLERERQRKRLLREAEHALRLHRLGIEVRTARIRTPTVGVLEQPQRIRREFTTKITIV